MRIVIYIYEDFIPIEVFGVYDVISKLPDADVLLVAEHKGVVSSNDKRISVNVEHTITEINQADILIIPGSVVGWSQQMKNRAVLNWIRQVDQTTQFTLGLCSGVMILAATKLLKKATTYWLVSRLLGDYGVEFVDQPIVQDRKYFTAEAAFPSMTLALDLIKMISGKENTQVAQLMLGCEDAQSQTSFKQLKRDDALTKAAGERFIDNARHVLSFWDKITNARLLMRMYRVPKQSDD